ncbi:MAG: hypothetical protein M1818_004977 [Claussenomyces sp. TS43310]|nr:MAG: hypothetical protein M1818_004977 [Claussenomyces sp. TS43310]
MAQLNDTLPCLDMEAADALQTIVLNIASITSGELQHLKTSAVVDRMADVYIQSNGTASPSRLIDALRTTPELFDELVASFGTIDDVQRCVLWAKNIALPNAVHHEVRTGLLALIVVCMVCACLTSGLRIYARGRSAAGIGICDYVLIIGTALAVGISSLFAADLIALTIQGSGSVWDITFATFKLTQISSTTEYSLYHAAVGCLKASILLFYLGLLLEKSWSYWVGIMILAVNIGDNIAGFFLLLFECTPFDYWNHWVVCICLTNYPDAIFVLGIVNIFTDFVIWMLPISMVWKVTASWKSRALSLLVILSGAVATAACAIRVYLIRSGSSEVFDGNLSAFYLQICTVLEVNLIVVCCNVPALRTLGKYYFSRWGRRTPHRSANFQIEATDPELLPAEPRISCAKTERGEAHRTRHSQSTLRGGNIDRSSP